MLKQCQDSYHSTFGTYEDMLDYHEDQAKNSLWHRCQVNTLQVEPLDKTSPLYGSLSDFASGVTQEAVDDTAENLGLAIRVNGDLYPVRETAYKSLLDRAKIGGTALPKLGRDVLANVLNACLQLFPAEALLLIRDEKVSAVHSGDSVDYSILPINELLATLKDTISGISSNKLKKICDSYMANRGARDVVAFLSPHGITPNRAVKLYKEYGEKTMEIVKNHPYQLCEIAGIGFRTADKIAMSMGFDLLSTERVDEGILYTLTDAEGKGNLCMEKHAFVKACLKILDTPQLTEDMVANRAARLIYSGKLISYQGNVYRSKTAYAESNLAELLSRQMRSARSHSYGDLEADLDAEELRLKLKLAPEQREAVKMALTQGLSVITGGPGTGKSMILRAILDIYRRYNPRKEICLCAPTGRAARRMEQSTGLEASTIHKALGLMAGEDGDYGEPTGLDADIILVDEVSMMDIHLAGRLLEAVKSNAQIVLIGDSDQLPSVGPGAVLSEMIASARIPVVRLDRVFRQTDGSRIAVNAKLIRHGNLSLEYGSDFRFVDSANMSDSANRIAELYMQEVAKYGVDNVALLSPYRQKTETGVNALNELLREMVNPPEAGKQEVTCGKRKFRTGDKVMQIKNFEDVNNGDVGYIRSIFKFGDEATVVIDFGDGRTKEYDSSELDMIDLGYASTIHKSQGSEYKSVIINLQCAHHIMLTRPLVYTAITRGKEKVIIVGERRALCIAIKKTDTEKRGTCLAHRLQELA